MIVLFKHFSPGLFKFLSKNVFAKNRENWFFGKSSNLDILATNLQQYGYQKIEYSKTNSTINKHHESTHAFLKNLRFTYLQDMKFEISSNTAKIIAVWLIFHDSYFMTHILWLIFMTHLLWLIFYYSFLRDSIILNKL